MTAKTTKLSRPKADASPQRQRFLEFLHLARLTEKQFREQYNVDSRLIWSWFNRYAGNIPDTDESWGVIERAAKDRGVTGLTLNWLNERIGESPRVKEDPAKPKTEITELPGKVPEGLVRLQYLDDFSPQRSPYVDVPASLLRNKLRLLAPHIRVAENFGDAMRGRIEDGDICFIDTTVTVFQKEDAAQKPIYACHMYNVALIREIEVHEKRGLRLVGTKPHEESYPIREEEMSKLRIRGRVIHVISGRDL